MKHHPTLPTKREPVKKGIIKRLHAVTKNRKQRVAATAMAGDFDTELPGRKIGMALAVIVGVHVVAAGLVFFHHWRLEGRAGESGSSNPAPVALASANAPLPIISKEDEIHPVRSGETYAAIAAQHKVDENALRELNQNTSLRAGSLIKIPPKQIAPKESPEVAALRESSKTDTRGSEVEIPKAIVATDAPKLVKAVKMNKGSAEEFAATQRPHEQEPRSSASQKQASATKAVTAPKEKEKKESTPKAASGRNYTVQNGDTLYRIAGRYKVGPEQLMKANGISDARKLKPGMTLSIPN